MWDIIFLRVSIGIYKQFLKEELAALKTDPILWFIQNLATVHFGYLAHEYLKIIIARYAAEVPGMATYAPEPQ